MHLPVFWNHALQDFLDGQGCCSHSQSGAVGNAEDMGINGNGRASEGNVENHIGGLAANAGKLL